MTTYAKYLGNGLVALGSWTWSVAKAHRESIDRCGEWVGRGMQQRQHGTYTYPNKPKQHRENDFSDSMADTCLHNQKQYT